MMLPESMHAWAQDAYGGADTVRLHRMPVPMPGRGEVLLRVRAASVNSGDIHLMRGEPLLVRAFFGMRRPKHAVRGIDAAGTVVALGAGVTEWAVGDEVVGELASGAFGEYAVASAARLVRRPPEVSLVHAAALPVAGGTAAQALALADVAAGGRVLVIGAGGGVGTYTVGLAAADGAEVWALCGQRARPMLERLGAVRTLDYRETPVERLGPDTFDAVVEIAGAAPLPVIQRLVRPGGVVVLVGGEGSRILGPVGRIAGGALRSIGSSRKIRGLAARPDPDVLRGLVDRVAAGALVPEIEHVFPFAQAAAALAHVEAGHALGKTVISFED